MAARGSESALASLTANYTDSEDDYEEDEASDGVVSIVSNPATPQPQPQPDDDQSESKQGFASEGSGSSPKTSVSSRLKDVGRNALGLVSYNDDQIDDEAVDDFGFTSDNRAEEEVKSPEVEKEEEDTLTLTVEDDDLIDISQDGDLDSSPVSAKKSRLPAEPEGKCSTELQNRIAGIYEKTKAGKIDLNKHIQRMKSFRNPSIYEKLIIVCNIDELGTNFPRDIYDAHEWGPSSFYDELAKVQKAEMDRREKERKEKTKVEFVSGTAKKVGPGGVMIPSASGSGVPDSSALDANKRKSKWDQRGVMPMLMPVVPQRPLGPPSLGSSTTVISAFGDLVKRPKL